MSTTNTTEPLTLPKDLSDVDALFMEKALGRRHPGTEVSQVELVDLRQGSASSFRVRVDYAKNPHDLPATMFVKGDFVEHRFTSAAAFASEVLYYEHLADALNDKINQPRSYFAGVDEDQQAIVILEDLKPRGVRFGDCEEPLDVDTVADGVRQLAAIQGRFWQGRGLESHAGVPDVTAVASLMVLLLQPDYFNDYIERERADFLSPALRDRLKIESALNAMFETDKELPFALVHGDAHLANTFREASGRLGFYDFQGVGMGPYIWDVTYFLTGALEPADRSAAEQDLLRTYLDELHRHGVEDVPSFDDAFTAHRRHMMHGYLNILTPVEMQADRFAVAMGRRFAAAMEELDTLGSFA